MAALLRHGAAKRLIGGSISMVQRVQAPVADEPRRQLVPRLMHTNKGAGEEGEDIRLIKMRDRRLRFQRFDREFTKILNAGFLLFSVYAILSCRDLLDEVERANKTGKK